MRTSHRTRSAVLHGTILALTFLVMTLRAEQFGPFTYMVTGDTVTITGGSIAGMDEVVIPAEIEGRPVSAIASSAFTRESGVTSVTIPASVTEIGSDAFRVCSALTKVTIEDGVRTIGPQAFGSCALTSVTIPASVRDLGEDGGGYAFWGNPLTSINVDPLNANYSSADGVLFDKQQTTLIDYPANKASGTYAIPESVTRIVHYAFLNCASLTSVTIPEGVTELGIRAFVHCVSLTSVTIPGSLTTIGAGAFTECDSLTRVTINEGVEIIGERAFSRCRSLRNVTIPASVWSIGERAFSYCFSLRAVLFLGNSPHLEEGGEFALVSTGFTIYFLPTSTGFTSPSWEGYPAVMLDEIPSPSGLWLLGHGLPLDAGLDQDLNGDGVSLLLAYALNLDPNENLRSSLPVPVLAGDSLSLRFDADAPGILYSVQTSTDLENWTTEGVTLSELDAAGRRTGLVQRDLTQRFLRLVVSRQPGTLRLEGPSGNS